MHHVEMRGQRIGRRVGRAQHRVLDGQAGKRRAEQHSAPRLFVERMRHHTGEAGDAQLEGLVGKHQREGIALLRHRRFDGMSNGVNAGAGGDAWRLGYGELRIEQGDARRSLGIQTGHLLVSVLIGDQRGALAFAARARRGGDRDEGQHRLRRLAHAPIILHLPAVGENEIAALRRVHRTAAAQAHQEVHRCFTCDRQTLIHVARGRVLTDAIISHCAQARGLQRVFHPSRVPGDHQARIRDQQHPLRAEAARQFAHPSHAAGAEDQLGARVIIKSRERRQGHFGLHGPY